MAGRQRALLEDGADRGSPHRLLPGQRLNCQDAVNDLVIVDRQTDMTGRVEDQLDRDLATGETVRTQDREVLRLQ
jgi:hypothetical protein